MKAESGMMPTASARRTWPLRLSPRASSASAISSIFALCRRTAAEPALITQVFVPCSSDLPTQTPRPLVCSSASAFAWLGSACILAALMILASRVGEIVSSR